MLMKTAPKVAPKNFKLRGDTLNSSTAVFEWDEVDDDPELIQGFFRGYQVIIIIMRLSGFIIIMRLSGYYNNYVVIRLL